MTWMSVLLGVLLGINTVNAIPTISAKGSKFFTSDGKQFYVKGIAYQLVPEDPLIDGDQCSRDASLMQTIGTNSIRVYHVDPNAKHDSCMKAFADAGIYIWLDLDTFNTQIEQTAPKWNSTQRDAFARVMDAFYFYDNLAGFFIGNEVLTTSNGSVAAPFVKAATRDLKAYRNSKNYRNIPIGYSAADIVSLRPVLQNYLACGANRTEAIDFFSLNAYSWCGNSGYQTSGYDILKKNSTNLNIPIFMSETGCQTARPRDFKDQEALFGDMADVWSGSIIYEWIEEANDYGLVKYGDKVDPSSPGAPPDGYPRSGTPIPIEPDFPNLSKVWKSLNPTGVKSTDYTPISQPVACPDYTPGAWEVYPAAALPSLGQTYKAGVQPTGAVSSPSGSPDSSTSNKKNAAVRDAGSIASVIIALFADISMLAFV